MTDADTEERATKALHDVMLWLARGRSDHCSLPAMEKRLLAFVLMFSPDKLDQRVTEMARKVGCTPETIYAQLRDLRQVLGPLLEKANEGRGLFKNREVGTDLLH